MAEYTCRLLGKVQSSEVKGVCGEASKDSALMGTVLLFALGELWSTCVLYSNTLTAEMGPRTGRDISLGGTDVGNKGN